MAIVAIIVLVPAGFASKIVAPEFLGQHDFGQINLSQFTYSISINCDRSYIDFYVYDGDLKPVQGAKTFLSYVDYSSPLLSNDITDEKGHIDIPLRGNTTFMRGLFTMLIEKKGFKSKEFQFRITPCYSDIKTPATPPPAQTGIPNKNPTTPITQIPEQKPAINPPKSNQTNLNSTVNTSNSSSIEQIWITWLNSSDKNTTQKWNEISNYVDRALCLAPAALFSTILLFFLQKAYLF
ncbi:hypothetical protein HY990_06335 [Candidatus Micrarchaeota archaeon]|nr:hypothetical protein [Candidatus Micrarchaeota archaeon]